MNQFTLDLINDIVRPKMSVGRLAHLLEATWTNMQAAWIDSVAKDLLERIPQPLLLRAIPAVMDIGMECGWEGPDFEDDESDAWWVAYAMAGFRFYSAWTTDNFPTLDYTMTELQQFIPKQPALFEI